MSTRAFRYTDAKSDKFWTITLEGFSHTVHYGRQGTSGQAKTKDFDSEEKAQKDFEKLIAQKIGKGYVETGVEATAAPKPKPSVPKAAAPVSDSGSEAKQAAEPQRAAASTPAPDVGSPEVGPALFEPRDGLLDHERNLAPWRPLANPGEAKPFDLGQCVERLAGIKVSDYGYSWHWESAEVTGPMTREEGHFWLLATTQVHRDRKTPKQKAKQLSKLDDYGQGVPGIRDTISALSDGLERARGLEAMAIMTALYEPTEILDALLMELNLKKDATFGTRQDPRLGLIPGIRPYLLPNISKADLDSARETLEPRLKKAKWPTGNSYHRSPIEFHLASALGMASETARLVASWDDNLFAGPENWILYYQRPQGIVLMLNDRNLVAHEMARLRLPLNQPWLVKAWLAHQGLDALGLVKDGIKDLAQREEAENVMAVLTRADAPQLAPLMLDLMLDSKAPQLARAWLLEHSSSSILGLSSLLGKTSRTAESALDLLRSIELRSPPALVTACTERLSDVHQAAFRAKVVQNPLKDVKPLETPPSWMKEGIEALSNLKKKPKVPAWLRPSDLPVLLVDGHRLQDEQVVHVLHGLAVSTLESVQPLVAGLKAHGDSASNDTFAWRLFETWLASGASSKEKWAMLSVGLLGNDTSALKLTPLIRKWPGESQHPRAVVGLACLEGIGSDTALMQINGIAQKIKFKGLKNQAREAMEKIANKRGMSRADLEDRIVPDCGLDEHGQRIFDFGPRKFTFVLTGDLKAMVKDEKGKLKPNLPAPGVKDDETLATASVAEWKILKKQIKDVAAIQALRLEQSMVTGRRWTKPDFERFLVRQPLMTHLVRLVLWGIYQDGEATPLSTFRVTEEQDFADREDEGMELPETTKVGIVHPMQITEGERSAWGEVFADYELVPPFQQLRRPIYRLENKEAKGKVIERFSQDKIAAGTLVSTLERLGWNRGMAEDGGVFYEHSKPFYASQVTAIVQYDGVPMGVSYDWDDQSIHKCFFVPGIYRSEHYPEHNTHLALGDVDPIVISEVLGDLHLLASKAK